MKKLNCKKGICIILSSVILIGMALGHFVFNSYKPLADSESSAKERLQAARNEMEIGSSTDYSKEISKTIRAIVTLKEEAVADTSDISNYTSNLKSKEDKIINSQDDIIAKVENITGNKVVVRTGYLVNSFSIDATRSQLKKIAQIEGVEDVCEAATYEPCMKSAINQGNVTAQLESKDYGYTGEGIVIAIIDTGVNYNHKDMVLDEGVKTKFTKEEWEEKIELLGHGKYMTDKVPYGYNYISGKDECLNESNNHGYHVSGIAAGNGEDIDGVARNAQIIGMKVFDEGDMITSDGLVCAIEDAVKLGVDVINMSLGSTSGFVTDEDYVQNAVENASKEGVICCISAGNDGLSSAENESTNILGIKDTSVVSSPGTALSSLTVASADNKVVTSGSRTDNVRMSSFSSWGPSNELNIKPEITAPGGNIEAACNDIDGYSSMSGTSMSSPYVAGAEAIMLNAIKSRGLDLNGVQLTAFMKNSLMNTADVLYDPSKFVPYSVRNQGAGLVDVYGAVNNNVLATYNGEAKVELGDFTESKSFEIVLTNYGNVDATYNLEKSQIYKDYTKDSNENYEYGIKMALDAFVTYNVSQITVPANGQATVQATVNIPENYENNSYIEAFISFKGNNVENIGLPLLGFYGDWDKEAIIDKPIYEEGDSVLTRLKATTNIEYGTALCSGNDSELLGVKLDKIMDADVTVIKPLENVDNNDKKIAKKVGLIGESSVPIIEENAEFNFISEEFEPTRAKIYVKEDGYYTFDFSIQDDADVSMVEYFIEENSLKGKNVLLQTTTNGKLSKEFKLRKDAAYVVSVEAHCMAPNKALASVKYSSSSGDNCYVLNKTYSSDIIAFSPNGDDVRDTVKPKVLQLRNAKEVQIRVLDKDKNSIRTLASLTDVRKARYCPNNMVYGNDCFSDYFISPSNGEYIGWDGKVYNKQSGQYDSAIDGQYYIEIESKITKDANVQTVVMPVKIDTEKPSMDVFEFKKVNDNYTLEFMTKDDVAMNYTYYVDVQYSKGAANTNQYETFNNKYIETDMTKEGNYVVDLSRFNGCNIKQVTVMVEDMAGNQTFKEYKANQTENDAKEEVNDEKIKGMGFYKLCDGVALSSVLRDGMSMELLDNKTIRIEGECTEDVSIVCNGGAAKYSSDKPILYTDGKIFTIDIVPDKNVTVQQLNIVVQKKDVEVFSQGFNIHVLRRKACDIKFVKNEKVLDSKNFADENTEVVYMEEASDEKVSFKLEVASKEQPFEKYNVDMRHLLEGFAYGDDTGPLPCNITYEGNYIYRVDISGVDDVVDVQLRCSYDSYFDGNINVCVAMDEDEYTEVKDGYEVKLVSSILDVYELKKSMLNSDGTLTIEGKLGTLPSKLSINKNNVNVDSSTCKFSYKLPIKKGLNFIKIQAVINGKEVSIDKCLHYEEVTFTWVDSIKEENGVINTDKDVFNLAGAIKSYSNVKSIIVCGEMMYSASDSIKTYEDKPFVKQFDYNISLVKGTNIIKIEVTTASNEVVEKVFTVNYQ